MALSKQDAPQQNPTFVMLSFLVVMVVVFVVVLGILPYRNQTPLLAGTPTPTPEPNAQYQFGITDYLTGNYEAAIEDFTRAIDAQYTPLESAQYRRGLAYYSYSVANQDESAADHAIADLLAALELDPNVQEVYPALGWAYYQKATFYTDETQISYFQQAFDIFQQGLELNKKFGKTDPQIYDGLGWTYYRLGHPEEAIEHFKLALNFNPDLLDAQEGLNAAKAELGK